MKYAFFEASAGASGDMILAALLDLGVSPGLFRSKIAGLHLPVGIAVKETRRSGLRGLKVDVKVKKGHASPARHWRDVEKLIKVSSFTDSVKANSLAVFKTLFKAEARVHGTSFQETHLHEAGADDAIIDVVGSCLLAEELKIGQVFCSPLNVGRGSVETSHGELPVPAPAVAEILRGAPVYSAWADTELVTPTGAAILATWAQEFIAFPETSYDKVGCGAGTRDIPGFPNILRVFYGEAEDFEAEKRVFQIEAQMDDENPQLLADFTEQALQLGALDAFLTPVIMKKGRLGTELTVLAEVGKMEPLIEAIFRETTSIGLRYFPVSRRALRREIRTVKVLGEEIGIKTAILGGEEVNSQPEFSDCQRAARKLRIPLKEVHRLALQEHFRAGRKKVKQRREK
jgi:uncharacterized protein (TIGR00299 family) protein